MTATTSGKTLAQRALAELVERARTGEPEPGSYTCGLCGREDGVQMFSVWNPRPGEVNDLGRRVTPGSHYNWGAISERDPSELTGRLICPCCSLRSDCPHRDGQSRPTFPAEAVA